VLQLLLDSHPLLDAVDSEGATALHLAAGKCDIRFHAASRSCMTTVAAVVCIRMRVKAHETASSFGFFRVAARARAAPCMPRCA
jgi:hypothetical protein